jgi:hypothetical protein
MNTALRIASGVLGLTLAAGLGACVTQDQKNKAAVEKFREQASGEFRSESGAELFIVPVRARMVTDEAIYVERRDAGGTVGRLLNIELSADGKRVVQRALTFTQEGQWRNLRENPEMFTALLPKDVRPAGTCNIVPADDANTLTYSCGGSAPEKFTRR